MWRWVSRPAGAVEQTRWLFLLAAVLALLLTLPAPVSLGEGGTVLLALASSGALIALWLHRYRTGRCPLALDALEACAVLGFALSCPSPLAAFGFVISATWFRTVYGSASRALLQCTAMAVAILAAIPLWTRFPGHPAPTPAPPVLAVLPILFLTFVVARYLVVRIFASEQAQQRDAALAQLGRDLLGVNQPGTIRDRAWQAVLAVCAATPGLQALTLRGDVGALHLSRRTDRLDTVAATMPCTVLPLRAERAAPKAPAAEPPADDGALPTAAGAPLAWLCLPLPEQSDNWLLLGAPAAVPADAVTAIQSVLNHVALALRISEAHNDLSAQALTDGLTGLSNRIAFTAAVELGLRELTTGLAVLFLDLDDFKTVNDGLGHAAGDELLRQVADRLRQAVRPGDVCARLGGDEFAVLLQDGADGRATRVGQRLVELIAAPLSLGGRPARVGASVGLARNAPGMSAEQLVQNADIAMYAAKAHGKNRVQEFGAYLLQPDPEAVFVTELAAAPGAGQLVVHYQPILSLEDGSCVGAEALVRWQHPTRGLLQPEAFIGLAERTGVIVDIGAYVLRRACADMTGRAGRQGPLAVHVNVSASQLADPGFVEAVRRAGTEFGLVPRQLVLELTESVPLEAPSIRSTLQTLAAYDIGLALDDFGTGYSCFTALRQLPLDILKIDQSFVADSPTSAPTQAVVESIVQLARRLGMQTIAEGVERLDQQRYLQHIGVDAAQGFLNLRAVPIAELDSWLAAELSGQASGAFDNVTRLAPRRPA